MTDPTGRPHPICVELHDFAWLRLVGPDARTFLQGYLTCDVDALAGDHALLGAFCNLQGRVVADVLVVELDGAPALWLHASLVGPVVDGLRKYLMFSKSKFDAPRDGWKTFGLIGSGTVAGLPEAMLSVAPYRTGIVARVPGADPRWLVCLPADHARTMRTEFEAEGRLGDARLWIEADIRARWPHLDSATAGAFLPQMLGLTDLGAVSFTKGCYLGQEVVARAQHRGQVKRHLMTAAWQGDSVPASGEELRDADGRAIGAVINAVAGHGNRGEALVVVNRNQGVARTRNDVRFEWTSESPAE